jgi:DNA-binding HxlR family transcriptional regulator
MVKPGEDLRRNLHDQFERGDVYAPECPSRPLLDHLTSRWGVLVLVLLLDRPHRFGELASLIGGVSDKMLSQTLKTLVGDGFVTREVGTDGPVRVTYALTDVGQGAAERLADLVEWLESNMNALVPA